jgi:hypothetical protein
MTEKVYCLLDCLVHGITTISGTEATNTGEFITEPCKTVLLSYQWARRPEKALLMAETRRSLKLRELKEMVDKVENMTLNLPDLKVENE